MPRPVEWHRVHARRGHCVPHRLAVIRSPLRRHCPTWSFISPSITKLPHLRMLFFYRCLTNNPQPIPSFLRRLGPSLQTLVLRENGHVGHVPTELGNLTRPRVLDLHKNNLNGSIPVYLDRLTGLWSLDLSSNILTGSIPCLSSPVLSIIDLSQNHLMGSIPPSISTCRSLIKMDLSRNQLTGSMPESSINDLKDLTLMDLSYNRLSCPLPSSLRSLVCLQALILKGNPRGGGGGGGFPHNSKRFVSRHEELNDLGSFQHELGRSNSIFTCPFAESPRASSRQKQLQPFDSRKLWRAEESERADNSLTGQVPFGREMVWRMRRKLRLYNNSGPCFGANSGLDEYLDSSPFSSGIGLCDTPKPGSARTVQHLFAAKMDTTHSERVSGGALHKLSVSVNLLLQILLSFTLVLL